MQIFLETGWFFSYVSLLTTSTVQKAESTEHTPAWFLILICCASCSLVLRLKYPIVCYFNKSWGDKVSTCVFVHSTCLLWDSAVISHCNSKNRVAPLLKVLSTPYGFKRYSSLEKKSIQKCWIQTSAFTNYFCILKNFVLDLPLSGQERITYWRKWG